MTRLELQGFKSFADKSCIHFEDGVTAIVGPNGCGKSNIVDAIRWVLGEQSTRTLRSEKMENVIFNGSQKRKPANLAEVSLSFDNTEKVLWSDYTHITLTRKLYRTGESEYRLNNISCRLKDITDLFLDTGIGADSYSIIELKMVEELISNKEGSRRLLFEEAAGIAKYRLRKKQTHLKLKDTQDDLERVEDVLFEIQKNLKTLEQQARRAERYIKLKDHYQGMGMALAARQVRVKMNESIRWESEETRQGDQLTMLRSGMDTLQAELERLKLGQLVAEKQVSVQQKAAHEFSSNLAEKVNQQALQKEKRKNFQEKHQLLQENLRTTREAAETLSIAIETIEGNRLEAVKALEDYQTQLPVLQNEVNTLGTRQKEQKIRMEGIVQALQLAQETLKKEEKTVDYLVFQEKSFTAEIERHAIGLQRLGEEHLAVDRSIKQIGENLLGQTALMGHVQEKHLEIQQLLVSSEARLEHVRENHATSIRKLDADRNEYTLTKSLIDNLEGFPESILFLKKQADWLKDAPLLSDVLFCEAPYRVALENYLQPFMNFFVVDTRPEAQKAVDLLRTEKKGRVDFFILQEIDQLARPRLANQEDPGRVPKEEALAISVLTMDEKYEALAHFLLRGVVLTSAPVVVMGRKGSVDGGERKIHLEKQGDFYSSLGRLSGGSTGAFEGKRIGRIKNLEILAFHLAQQEIEIIAIEADRAAIQYEITGYKTSIENLNIQQVVAGVAKLEADQANILVQKNNLTLQTQRLVARTEELKSLLDGLASRTYEVLPTIEQLKGAIDQLETSLGEARRSIEETAKEFTEQSTRFNGINIRYHQIQGRVENFEKELAWSHQQHLRLEEQAAEYRSSLEKLTPELTEDFLDVELQASEIIELYEEKKQLDRGLAELEESYHGLRSDIIEKEKELHLLQKKRENLDLGLKELHESKTRSFFERESIRERACLEFSMTDSQWTTVLDQELETDQMASHLFVELEQLSQKLKDQLATYGAINPMAMDAYEEIQIRYNFILAQKEDLLAAKNSLLDTIEEIDGTATEKFMTAFQAVRQNFMDVFRTLFDPQDACDLVLLDPGHPLDSEIEIMARPKGKRPLTINQLSGGEKTLTATAILFSLYLLKPAPFCIFDEVDAPLDDTNIEKFNTIVRKFSATSQFIVVSHNKKTIASADIMYGITMAEPAISTVVAVDLRDVHSAA